jgi:hypothetical protein
MKIRIHKKIFPFVLYGCETQSLREQQHNLHVFGNKVLRKMYNLRKKKWVDNLEYYIRIYFAIYAVHQVFIRKQSSSVSTVTRQRPRRAGFNSLQMQGLFAFAIASRPGSGTHPASYPMNTGGSFPWSSAAGAWSWPLNPIYCRAIPKFPHKSSCVVFN